MVPARLVRPEIACFPPRPSRPDLSKEAWLEWLGCKPPTVTQLGDHRPASFTRVVESGYSTVPRPICLGAI